MYTIKSTCTLNTIFLLDLILFCFKYVNLLALCQLFNWHWATTVGVVACTWYEHIYLLLPSEVFLHVLADWR